MNTEQLALLRSAAAGLVTELEERFPAMRAFQWARDRKLSYLSVSFETGYATAFDQDGDLAIAQLSASLRAPSSAWRHIVDDRVLRKQIASAVTRCWTPSARSETEEVKLAKASTLIKSWIFAHEETKAHFVPCSILPDPARAFRVGPITFTHRLNFEPAGFGIDLSEKHDDFRRLYELMTAREAHWIGCVEIFGQERDRSTRTAELSVDVALSALQLAFGPQDAVARFSRMSARSSPPKRQDIVLIEGRRLSSDAWTLAGFGIAPVSFEEHLARSQWLLEPMGSRIAGYFSQSSIIPLLDEAWCNAAYWYHEALAEELPTVAAVKLETAIEILFKGESSSGSSRRIRLGFSSLMGLEENDRINDRTEVRIRDLADAITSARSRVLHGTWPTLGSDLPAVRNSTAISVWDIERVARTFLLEVAVGLDEYIATGETADDVVAFLEWNRSKRLAGG